MNIFRLMRFFLPLRNPIGFGLAGFIELSVAALLVCGILAGGRIGSVMRKVAARPILSMVLLAALPIVLRLLLLRNDPIPVPTVSDDFSYLLLGDTLAHFRLANPTHPMHRFFETRLRSARAVLQLDLSTRSGDRAGHRAAAGGEQGERSNHQEGQAKSRHRPPTLPPC